MGKFSVFLYGVVAALGALFFELLLLFIYPANSLADIFSDITSAMLLAVLIEEILKFIFLFRLRDKIKIGTPYSAPIIFGAGFAFTEIFFFHPNEVFYLSYFPQLAGIALVHIATSGLMGYFLQKYCEKIKLFFLPVFFSASLLHFAYNAAVIKEKQGLAAIFSVFALILILFSFFSRKVQIKPA